MKIGDTVVPVASFNFDYYGGPADIEDTGTIMSFDVDGDAIVLWNSSGEMNTHIVEGSSYCERDPDAFELFGVVLEKT